MKYIIHCCNNRGKWGKGFVLALGRRWPLARERYLGWSKHGWAYEGQPFALGYVQFVYVDDSTVVCNMIGQHDVRPLAGTAPIRYGAIATCLQKVRELIQDRLVSRPCSVHCPRFGAGLAGGKWEHIEALLEEHLVQHDIPVTVYDL